MSIRVVIVDDHPVVRDGIRLTIERSRADIEVVGEACDGMDALRLGATTPVDVWILDVTMPNMNGIETCREVLKKYPASKVIILSLHGTHALVEEALAAGASGYLTKETATRTVVEAVAEVYAGRGYLCLAAAKVVMAGLAGRDGSQGRRARAVALTGQERKVLQLVAEGSSTKEVAVKLGLAVNTVHAHRNNLMAKLDLHKQSDLIRYAIKEGIASLY